MVVALVRRRFVIYLQIGVLFVGGLYLLFKYDQIPTPTLPTSFGLSHLHDPAPNYVGSSTKTHGPYPDELATLLKGVGIPDVTDPTSTSASITAHSTTKEVPAAATTSAGTEAKGDEKDKTKEDKPKPSDEPTVDVLEKARSMIPSILDPNDTSVDRMSCPGGLNNTRYGYLVPAKSEKRVRFFFALNLRQCIDILPRLLGSVMEAIRFLGPEHCALSIVEGNSDDGTYEVLELLKAELKKMGVPYTLTSSKLNPSKGDRIEKLSFLRSMALAPVSGPVEYARKAFPNSEDVSELTPYEVTRKDGTKVLSTGADVAKIDLVEDATVIFLNDVVACVDDILELVHQRAAQGADMTCAMDWNHATTHPVFYDVWVSRALNGDTFFEIGQDGSWDKAADLFPTEPIARVRNEAVRPFQVFACWNGAVAFTAKPMVDRKVLFRPVLEGECFQGEPQLFCKDMWWAGYGKIAVVPSVNLQYTEPLGRKTKEQKGYTHEWVAKEAADPEAPPMQIDWRGPPDEVKCMPSFDHQSWKPWNETLVDL